jgi:hypothetical protein
VHVAFKIPHVYDYITQFYVDSKLEYRSHGDKNVRKAKGDTEHIKRLKRRGVEAYEYSNE